MFHNHKWSMWSSIDYTAIVKTSLINEPIIYDDSVPTEELKLNDLRIGDPESDFIFNEKLPKLSVLPVVPV